jgi:transposase-like protein
MAHEVDEVLATQWRERLKRHSESGLTIEAFCEKEGVSESVFYTWKRNLQDSMSAPMASQAADAARRPGKRRAKGLRRQRPQVVPTNKPATKHPQEFLRLPVRGVRSIPWIELTLVDGTVVRIPQENLAALTTVLRTLRAENSDGRVGEARHV